MDAKKEKKSILFLFDILTYCMLLFRDIKNYITGRDITFMTYWNNQHSEWQSGPYILIDPMF